MNYNIHDIKSASSKIIGSGAFGRVILTNSIHNNNLRVAIKVLVQQYQKDVQEIQDEFQILSHIDHPNIVRYFETYIDDQYVFLVMEFVDGGELLERIIIHKKLN